LQLRDNASIALYVLLEFFLPELRVALWCSGDVATSVSMPEASMHEHHGLVSREYEVGPARKPSAMKPVPKPERV